MAKFKVLGGDFKNTSHIVVGNLFHFSSGAGRFEKVPFTDIEQIEVVDENNKTSSGVGSALIGGVLLGGVGLVTGAIIGKKNIKQSVAVVKLLDNREFLAVFDNATLQDIQGVLFNVRNTDIEDRRRLVNVRKFKEQQKIERSKAFKKWAFIVFALLILLIVVTK